MENTNQTTVAYIPPRCSKVRVTLIPYHIDKVNSARSKIIPIGSDIKDMGIGNFVERYCKKWKVNETKARSRK